MASPCLSASNIVVAPTCPYTKELCFVGLQQGSGLFSLAGIGTPFFGKEIDRRVQKLAFLPKKLCSPYQRRLPNQTQADVLTSSSDVERFFVWGGV